ncbi:MULTISPECIES: type II toxin-antitoxin system VapC family toxin [Mesorhizobium]|uniref:Ribonuclease VapC n=1 Tax=Rhizobium loti TaxID=381 RepID=A0A8E2WKF0_RHILI|nr:MULTISPECIES: type II toxin-antitoxin system VapC family toxin [Mesorhizobium]AZO44907.1 type II toxin-antitoxin system VapC family toxin [Mesorhizobium sp. M7D.F.Ca.US.005.01.1.1]PWJ94201.1 tRNA(fMet)-specific endonuclease VapC [Mesorhizobium loti]RUX92958.1 type II toxin-antitoxin system VapC family toxin [Mesorhizobium sp. M7D.F.Ca.US.004.01.2.1]RVA34835.1 type II toxin-antitoxin system VapC family toxin [Mesorhizobium sp. M7D.F.Ca.US.004.03.1.1]
MIYLLDTNAVIAVIKGDAGLLALLKRHKPQDFALSAIVAHELYYGAEKSQRRAENLARIEALQFPVLEFDREDARHAGEIRATLATLGTPIGPYDALIGGQARARNLTLMTRNVREFERIKDLSIETW